MKKHLLFILLIIRCWCFGQGNIINISSTLPNQLLICGAPKTFIITIYNPSPFGVTSDTLKLTLPLGITYQVGSIIGAGVSEQNISIPNKPVFLLPTIGSLATPLNITIGVTANCNIIPYSNTGGLVENIITVDYTANNTQNYDSYTTPIYTVKQPNLAITNMSNQSYAGNVGDTYVRCITITNNDVGELSQFTFTDIHGNGIQVSNVNNGVWVNSGTTETVTFNASNFNSIGNNNGLFEQGESIVVCETVHVLSCFPVASNFTAGWGCNNQVCQFASSAANVIFPNLIPNVVITPMSPPMNSCMGAGHPSIQKLMITNTGLGQATNIYLDIFQTNGNGYNSGLGSNIDENSFTMKMGSSAPVSIISDSTESTDQLNCMAANAKGRVFLTIPYINPGDTVYLEWNSYSCCYNSCTNTGQPIFNGWAYQGSYSNVCQTMYVINTAWGRVYSQLYGNLDNNFSPSVLDSGQVGTFDFIFSSYAIQQPYPGDTSGHWEFIYTLPTCLVNSGGMNILSADGTTTWIPVSVNASGNAVTAVFKGAPPFDLNQAQVKINLTLTCNGCSGGQGSVSIQAIYVPSNSCNCQVTVSCQSVPIYMLCPSPYVLIDSVPTVGSCPEGMVLRGYSFKRTSYGKPDNEAGGGNGLPDPSGSLNFSKIKINRAMFGDTITADYHGKVRTSFAHPIWQYCYQSSTIANGNLLSFLDSKLLIYRGGSLLASCLNVSPAVNTAGTVRTFFYDLSVAGLITSGCLPTGFNYLNDDSIVFTPRYKVTVNTNNQIFNCGTIDNYYLSDSINPHNSSHKFMCYADTANCFVLGYHFDSQDENYYNVKSCDTIIVSQKYFLSIGPCCSNYEGGNLFPYEYRNWAHIKTLTTIVPNGYKFVSAEFKESRTAGTGVFSTSAPILLTPLNPNSVVLTFPIEHYFLGYGGILPLSDDGFSGILNVTIVPSCKVTPAISQPIQYDWTFAPTTFLTGLGSFPTYISASDYIVYNAPNLFIQSTLQSVNTPDSSAIWDITLSNLSNVADAENSWLADSVISGVSVVQVVDLNNHVVVPKTGSIYQLGKILADSIRHFRITCNFTSCLQDSTIIYAGWNCADGYPTHIDSYPCTLQKITLKETPLIPALDLNVTGPPTNIQLCDTANYVVEGINIQSGTFYNVLLTTILPPGVIIVPGSSKLSYPLNSAYTAISDPVLITGSDWQWNLSAINNIIDTSGLKGFQDSPLNSFKVSFKAITNCSFTSGSIIGFNLKGNAACGLVVSRTIVSPQLIITGASQPYTTAIVLSTSYISPCAASSTMKVAAINMGTTSFGTTDSIAIVLPEGVSYQSSFAGIHNAPSNPTPVQSIFNNQIILKWNMPSGVQLGDSMVFTFNYSGSPADISCGISYFQAKTLSIANVVCTSTGSACNIDVITGSDTLPVFTYKGYLSLSNSTAYSISHPPIGEIATIGFTINNTGQNVFATNNTIISYYSDSNGNGIYNIGDVFIVNDTLNALIPANGSYSYSSNIFIPAGQACSVIAVLDTTINHCSCITSQIAVNIPVMHAGLDTSVCSGQTIVMGFPSITGYTYLWTPSSGLSSTTISSPTYTGVNNSNIPITTYYEVNTNRINCASTDTVKVVTFSNPILAVSGTDTICFGTHSGNAMATIIGGGTPPFTYSWNTIPIQTNDSAIGLIAGTYSVTVTDSNGCSAIQSMVVNQSGMALTATITSQTNLVCNAVCNGNVTLVASGGTPSYTFSWNTTPIQITANVTSLCANSYSVTITDAKGCTIDTAVIITEPTAMIASTSILSGNCTLGNNAVATITVSGGAGSYNYLWSNGQTNSTATGLSAGTYFVTVTDANSCAKIDTVNVTSAVQVTVASITTHICEGQNITIDALASGGTPIYSFLWSTSQTTQNITVSPTSATTYSVTVTDANGCKDSVPVSITVNSNPIVDFRSDTIGCSPLCLTFHDLSTVSNGTNQIWLWSFGDGSSSDFENPIHCYLNNTIYFPIKDSVGLTVISSEGCSTTLIKNNFITVNPSPVADFDYSPQPVTILAPIVSFQNQSLGATSWQWDFSNGNQDSMTVNQNPYYTYLDTGKFVVNLIVKNNYNCTDTIARTILIGPDWTIYIPNAFTPNDDGVNDGFLVKGYGIIDFEMLIFDRWGNLIFKTKDINKPWDGRAKYGNDVAQIDVYVYDIKATDVHKLKHNYKGIVTLVR